MTSTTSPPPDEGIVLGGKTRALKFTRPLLRGMLAVRYSGESFTAFVRAACRREIERRKAEWSEEAGRVHPVVLALLGALAVLVFLGWPRSEIRDWPPMDPPPAPPVVVDLGKAPGAVLDLAPADLGEDEPKHHRRPARPEGPALLTRGLEALRRGMPVSALRECKAAAALPGKHRGGALLCQARAAAALHWHAMAVALAEQAIGAGGMILEALIVQADAYQAMGDCKRARPLYLRADEIEPGTPGAEQGMRACRVDRPDAGGPDA